MRRLARWESVPVIAFAALLAFGLAGCSKEEAPAPVVRRPAPKAEAKPVETAPSEAVKPEKEPPVVTLYDPVGKRDPFVPFIKVVAKAVRGDLSSLPPLQRYDLGELKFVGVIWGAGLRKALVEDAEGKGYTIGVGTKIGSSGGVVTRITENEIVVKEAYRDYTGRTVERESSLKLDSGGGK